MFSKLFKNIRVKNILQAKNGNRYRAALQVLFQWLPLPLESTMKQHGKTPQPLLSAIEADPHAALKLIVNSFHGFNIVELSQISPRKIAHF